jgi:hypothetical protein
MKVNVRKATHDDLPWIVGQLKDFSQFFGSKINLFPNEEIATQKMSELVQNHFVMVAESERGMMGFICGIIGPHFFNPFIQTLTELFWWVKEEFRLSRAALLLFNAFDSFAEASGVHWVNFSLETASPVKDSFLLKRGYVQQERSFLKEFA